MTALMTVFLFTAGFSMAEEKGLYGAKETSLDVFASYVAAEKGFSHVFETNIRGGHFGGGLGVNHFLSPNIGVGTDVNMSANGGKFVDSATANLLVRLPLGNSGLAPYAMGGGGRSYDPSLQWVAQAGIGLELRSEKKSGLFVDGRYVWGEKSGTDNLLLRAGFRVMF
jgi:hypothetical protein